MKLNLGRGIDNLTFGLNQDEVISLIGEPDRVYIDEDDDNEIICDWNDLKIRLTFYKNENLRFGYLRAKNVKLTINDCYIIGKSINSVKNILKSMTWELDNFQFFETYFNEEYWLTIHVDFNTVEEIEMGVPIKNEAEYDWPS